MTLKEKLKQLQELGALSVDEFKQLSQQVSEKNDSKESPKLLKRHEVANYLGVTTMTVDRWANEGKLKKLQMGNRTSRFLEEDVIMFALGKKNGKTND